MMSDEKVTIMAYCIHLVSEFDEEGHEVGMEWIKSREELHIFAFALTQHSETVIGQVHKRARWFRRAQVKTWCLYGVRGII